MRSRSLVTLRKPRPRRFGAGATVVGAYAMVAVLVAAAAVGLRGTMPWAHPSPRWSMLSPFAAAGSSVLLSVGIAATVIAFTRVASRRFGWARRLADHLRPTASAFSTGEILAVAVASSVAEELLFRGVLVPWLGVLPSALAFGLAHQMKGPARFAWIAFSFVVGALLGAVYEATGSLVGPIVAHAMINAVNLAWLKAGRRDALAPRLAQRLSEA